jgi:hypothetical protein
MTRIPSFALLTSLACALASCVDDDGPDISATDQRLIGGTLGHRRELISGGCTGTILGRRWVLRAAHCSTDGYDGINGGSEGPYWPTPTAATAGGITTSTDGVTWSTGPAIERTFSLAHDWGGGPDDVQLVRLAAPGIPTSFLSTYPSLATSYPTTGQQVTQWGAGCFASDGMGGWRWDGKMRFATFTFPAASGGGCYGDSGGPLRNGSASSGGAVWGVNSTGGFGVGTDGYGNVVTKRAEILAIMTAWGDGSADPSPDISLTAWCTHDGAELFWGDVDGNGEPDAICHDVNTGMRWIATSFSRLVRQSQAFSSSWCAGSNEELHIGDFNGDGRTDLLCRTKNSGRYRIDLASTTGAFDGANDYDVTSSWCSHAGANLLLGDFNGDRRTDLMCRDPFAMWIQYAQSAPLGFPFINYVAWQWTTSWCTHANARLYTGDFNRDGRTDLLCFTRTLGDMFTAIASGSGFPFSGTTFYTPGLVSAGPDRFCDEPGSVLSIFDVEGDGASDLVCRQSNGLTWPSVRSKDDGSPDINGGIFGWNTIGGARPRHIAPASQPWQRRQLL